MTTLAIEHADRTAIAEQVASALSRQPVTDMHTHVYPPTFGASPDPTGLLLWGADELVTYHYLVAEVYRIVPPQELPYEKFWAMTRQQQADHIWKHLFVEHTPVSEACRGVLTTLKKLGLDPNEKTLEPYRCWFRQQTADGYIDLAMKTANVDSLTMTNPVFDDQERAIWERRDDLAKDKRFKAVLRIDPLLCDWPGAVRRLRAWGYQAAEDFSGQTVAEVRRFLEHWLDRMQAIYAAMSLPPEFRYPDSANPRGDQFLRDCLMPVLAERRLPWAMMIGVRRRNRINPALCDAGDSVAQADVQTLANLCRDFPRNKFLVTMLSRENQHELAVTARKFSNLMVFGCWWFLNNPSLVEEITRMRVELLGTSFIPQHSDARILDQIIYKWEHNRAVIAKVLTDKYADLAATGFQVTPQHIQRDVALLLRENFREFVKR